jgi:hypothetical protein
MSAIVFWKKNQRTPKDDKPGVAKPKETQSVPRLNFFKLEFTCPCKGHANPPLNSRKSKHVLAQCGCPARFSVSHHIESDSLWVKWFWRHNQDPYSHNDMVVTCAPKLWMIGWRLAWNPGLVGRPSISSSVCLTSAQ